MIFFSWFDDRTLMACFCMLVTVFAFMLLVLRMLHPRLPGVRAITHGFWVGAVATFLLFAQGIIPAQLSLVGGGGLSILSSLLIYRGVLQFCQQQRPTSVTGVLPEPEPAGLQRNFFPFICAVSLISFVVIIWSTLVQPSEPVRVVAITGTMAITRWLICWSLLRAARGRVHLRALGITVGIVALVMTGQALAGAISATAAHRLDPTHLETPSLLFGVLVASIQGVLFLMMFAGTVTESIHEQAQLDYLTGILNRRGIEAALDAEMARTRRTRVCFAMLLIDVDHFKQINDRCGHACGDESLRLVAQTILRTVRIYDRVGRFGGDEFMLLLPQTDSAEALLAASRILDEIRKLPLRMKDLPITVSIGATCCWSQEDSICVMRRADAALYEAKRLGRNRAELDLGSVTNAIFASGQDKGLQAGDEQSTSPVVLMAASSLPSEA